MRTLTINAGLGRAAVIAGSAVILALLAYEVAHGTPMMFALGVAAALFIPLSFLAVERPLIFPLGLYVMLAPFEDIMSVGHMGTINKMIGIATLGAVLFSLFRRGELAKPSSGLLTWFAVIVWMGVSGLWALDQLGWQQSYLTIIQNYILYAVIAVAIATPSDIEVLCTCSVIGGLCASAVAIWPLISGGSILTAGARISLPANNVHHETDPNIFAASLLLPFAIAFSSTLSSRKIGSILGNLAGLALLAITIVLTGSRAAMLATLILTIYVLLANKRRRLFATGLLIIAGAAILPFSFDIASRWSTAISSGGAGREQIWQVGFLAFKDHWLFGYGYGSFAAAYDRFVLQAPLTFYVSWHRAPHDILIETGVELGIIGVVLVVLAFFMQFRDLRMPQNGSFLDDIRIALQATILAVSVDALFLGFMDRKFIWVLFTMIALVRSTAICKRRTECATASSLTPAQVSPQAKSIASSSLSGTAG